jgi:hypothetical protein
MPLRTARKKIEKGVVGWTKKDVTICRLWMGFLSSLLFATEFFGKRKGEERERFRRILTQVSNILKIVILSQNNL